MSHTRNLIDREVTALARVSFHENDDHGQGWVKLPKSEENPWGKQERGQVLGYFKHYNDADFAVESILLESLHGFGLIYPAGVTHSSHVYRLTDEGRKVMEQHKPYPGYGCGCKDNVRLFCVCRQSTYCPNPDHTGNGCHGSHD